MWSREILIQFIGFCAGVGTAAGLFSFIVGLGVVSNFADRSHTGKYIPFYEDCIMAGGIIGNLIWIFQLKWGIVKLLLPVFTFFAGMFVGCWAMALAEILNIFPIFIRRARIHSRISWIILAIALGKGLGSLLYFIMGW